MLIRFISVIILSVFALTNSEAKAEQIYAIPKPQLSASGKSPSDLKATLVDMPSALEYFATPRIVGGTTTGSSEFPEFVQLWVAGGAVGGDPSLVYAFCGASLISSNKVLTAAHCTDDFGASDLYAYPKFYSFNSVSSGGFIPVSAKAENQNYNSVTKDSDVSVLTLNRSSSAPKASVYGGTDQLAGITATVIGTGRLSEGGSSPSTLQKVSVPIVTNNVCKSSYGSSAITSNMLCAGLVGGGKDSCQGDSGSPLWVTVQGKKAQSGIVSWGVGCALPNYYGVYARTSALVSFIRQYAPSATIVTDPPSSEGFLPAIYSITIP